MVQLRTRRSQPPGDLQLPGTEVEIVVDAHEAAQAVQRIRAAGAMAMRTVIDGNPRTGDLIGVAFAPQGNDIAYYMPVWHAGLERNADAAAVAALEEVLVDGSIPKRGYDLKRELLAWRRRGIAIQGLQFDAMLAAYLTNSRLKVPTLPVLAPTSRRSRSKRRNCWGAAGRSAASRTCRWRRPRPTTASGSG